MNTQRLQSLRVHHGYHILPVQPGMQLEIHEKVGEGNNQRIRRFKGLVIKVRKPKHAEGSFTIRGKVAGVSIEKIYPLSFPNFTQVLLLDEYKIRRAKLYYMREKIGKDAKMKSILTQSERGVDLMKLAKDEIDALQLAYAPAGDESVTEVQDMENQPVDEAGTETVSEEIEVTVEETVVESADGTVEEVIEEVTVTDTIVEETTEESAGDESTDEAEITVTETVIESEDGTTEVVIDEVRVSETITEEITDVSDSVDVIGEAADAQETNDTTKE